MSLRDVCGGRVSVFPGPFPNTFRALCSQLCKRSSPESGKGSSERESRFFRSQFLVRRNGRPALGIAIWHVKSGMVLIDNVDIFNDDMFCDLGCQVNELDIVVELIKGFNPVVIF